MGVRRMIYRLSCSYKLWVPVIIFSLFYLNLLHIASIANSAEREVEQSQEAVAEMMDRNAQIVHDVGEGDRRVDDEDEYDGDDDEEDGEYGKITVYNDDYNDAYDDNVDGNNDNKDKNFENGGDDENDDGDGADGDDENDNGDDNNNDHENVVADVNNDNDAADGDNNNNAAPNDDVDNDNNDENETGNDEKHIQQNPEEINQNKEILAKPTDVGNKPEEKIPEDQIEKNKNINLIPDVKNDNDMSAKKTIDNILVNKLKQEIKPGIKRDEGADSEIKQENKPDEVKPKVQGESGEAAGLLVNDPAGVDQRTGRSLLTYSGHYNKNETHGQQAVVKVLLLTYQRAGSSYVGELLTSGGGAMYVFEPLFVWRKMLGPTADSKLEADSARVLGDLLDCRQQVINAWKRRNLYYFRRKPEGARDFCLDAHLRLLKTIRARAHFVKPWIKDRPDIKVVHLVRDPRGILNSVRRGGRLWSDNNRNVALQCGNIEEDLQLEDLGPSRYLRVHYEDLVDKPLEETKRIFTFMGIDVNHGVMTYLQQHAGLGQPPAEKQGYLNTYRDSNYRHDHWKARMDNREVEYIQHECRGVMARLGYTPLPPT